MIAENSNDSIYDKIKTNKDNQIVKRKTKLPFRFNGFCFRCCCCCCFLFFFLLFEFVLADPDVEFTDDNSSARKSVDADETFVRKQFKK